MRSPPFKIRLGIALGVLLQIGCSLTFDSAERGRFTPDDASSDAPDDGSGGDDVALDGDAASRDDPPVEDSLPGEDAAEDAPVEDAPSDGGDEDVLPDGDVSEDAAPDIDAEADADPADATVDVGVDTDGDTGVEEDVPPRGCVEAADCPMLPHAQPSCQDDGSCVHACELGYGDANGDLSSDGCECQTTGLSKTVCDHINDTCSADPDICCADGELVHRMDRVSDAVGGPRALSMASGERGTILAWIETNGGAPDGDSGDQSYRTVLGWDGSRQVAPMPITTNSVELAVAQLGEGYILPIVTRSGAVMSPSYRLTNRVASTFTADPSAVILDTTTGFGARVTDVRAVGSAFGAALVWRREGSSFSGDERCMEGENCLRLVWYADAGTLVAPEAVTQTIQGTLRDIQLVANGGLFGVAWQEQSRASAPFTVRYRIFSAALMDWADDGVVELPGQNPDAALIFPLGGGFGVLIQDGAGVWTLHHRGPQGALSTFTNLPIPGDPMAGLRRSNGNALLLFRENVSSIGGVIVRADGTLGTRTQVQIGGLGTYHVATAWEQQGLMGQTLYSLEDARTLIELRALGVDSGHLSCGLPLLRWPPGN